MTKSNELNTTSRISNEIPYQTDKQIKDETDALLIECLEWARELALKWQKESKWVGEYNNEDVRALAITRFLYLEKKILDHSPKYYRNKELKTKMGGEAIIK